MSTQNTFNGNKVIPNRTAFTCLVNEEPHFWWEFTVGKTYYVNDIFQVIANSNSVFYLDFFEFMNRNHVEENGKLFFRVELLGVCPYEEVE